MNDSGEIFFLKVQINVFKSCNAYSDFRALLLSFATSRNKQVFSRGPFSFYFFSVNSFHFEIFLCVRCKELSTVSNI